MPFHCYKCLCSAYGRPRLNLSTDCCFIRFSQLFHKGNNRFAAKYSAAVCHFTTTTAAATTTTTKLLPLLLLLPLALQYYYYSVILLLLSDPVIFSRYAYQKTVSTGRFFKNRKQQIFLWSVYEAKHERETTGKYFFFTNKGAIHPYKTSIITTV
jgi:hypothetical protein